MVAAFFAAFFVTSSSANLAGSSFEGNDGNLVVNTSGNTDWCTDFPAPAASAACTTPIAGLHTGIDLASGTGDNSLGQGTKEDNAAVKVVAGSIPPQKSDLTRFYEASELSGSDVFLYLAWERTNNLGNANMDFEINADGSGGCPGTTTGPCTISRSNGDILVTYDFGGSGAPTLGINRWLTTTGTNPYDDSPNVAGDCFSANALPCWGDHKTLSQSISEGAVNTGGSVVDPINPNAPRTIVQDGFGEAAINLTDAGVITESNGCEFGQATTFLKSRSSSSFTSEVKDFIAPVSTPLVSNCGALIISKTDSKSSSGLAGAEFTITGPDSYSNVVETGDDGTVCVDGLTPGDYAVTETGAPDGYAIDDSSEHDVTVGSGDCDNPDVTGDSLDFSDAPTSDIQVNFRDGGSGTTSADISCDNTTGTQDLTAATGWDTSDTETGIEAPTTVTCTITIDP
jgi:Prealbumin-like fold domain